MRYNIIIVALIFFMQSASIQGQSFQQQCDHTIHVSLNDIKHELICHQKIRYTNNSNDTLKFIYFHLWAIAYSDRETALAEQQVLHNNLDMFFAKEEDRGRVKNFKALQSDKKLTIILDEFDPDICKINLIEPIPPGSYTEIEMDFEIKIPSAKFSRLGRIEEAYFITQWYPKPAVYDTLGWHIMPYLDQGEFFSEFGNYEVHITVPSNYIIAATGEIQNNEEKEFLLQKSEQYSYSPSATDISFPVSETVTKTLIYKQERVHDFAWIADKRFHVLHDTLMIPGREKSIDVFAYFTNESAKYWQHSIKYLKRAVLFYSDLVGTYPYNIVSAVDGTISAGGGMEYPTITIINKPNSDLTLEEVIVHEVGHNWFYGILASNERDYPWMDEGINSYYESRYFNTYYSDISDRKVSFPGFLKVFGIGDMDYAGLTSLLVQIAERKRINQKVSLSSNDYSAFNYGMMIYGRVPQLVRSLELQLGTEVFDQCIRSYYNEWKFRHPYPNHFRKVIEDISRKDVNWLFDDAFDMERGIEYKLYDVGYFRGEKTDANEKVTHSLLIGNNGLVAAPFNVRGYKNSKLILEANYSGIYGGEVLDVVCPGCELFIINEEKILPELDYKNNSMRVKGLFRKVEPFKFSILPQIERSDRTQLFVLPLAGWNNSDKWMPGITLHNISLLEKKLEFVFTPLYGIRANQLNGMANIHFNMYPRSGATRRIQLGVKSQKFSYDYTQWKADTLSSKSGALSYQVLAPFVEVELLNANPKSETRKKLRYQYNSVEMEQLDYTGTSNGVARVIEIKELYHNIDLVVSNRRKLDPFRIAAGIEFHSEYFKGYAEAMYKITYNKVGKGIGFRFFASIYDSDNPLYGNYYSLSGTDASTDYKFSHLYVGRDNSEIWNKQFQLNEGGFKTYVPTAVIDQSGFWMSSINIELDFPGPLPMVFFGDIGTYKDVGKIMEKDVFMDAGVALKAGHFFQVYFPFLVGENLSNYYDLNDIQFGDRIRFQLNLPLMGFEKLRDQISYQIW